MIYQEPPARLDSCWNWQTCFFIRIWSVSQLRMLIGTNFSCWEKGRTRCPDRQAAQTLQVTIMNSAERKKIRGKKRPTDGKKLTLVNSKLSLHAQVLTDTWHRLMWLYTDKPTKWPADCCSGEQQYVYLLWHVTRRVKASLPSIFPFHISCQCVLKNIQSCLYLSNGQTDEDEYESQPPKNCLHHALQHAKNCPPLTCNNRQRSRADGKRDLRDSFIIHQS